jgi:hypothetical protein
LTEQTAQEVISIVRLKELARNLLDPNSVLRELILAEPDRVLKTEAASKLVTFSRMLERELASCKDIF